MQPRYRWVKVHRVYHRDGREVRTRWTWKHIRLVREWAVRCGNRNVFRTVQRWEKPNADIQTDPHRCPLYFDFDSEALATAMADAVSVVDFLTGRLSLPEHVVRVWFSGRRGFHIAVHAEALGMAPHPELTYAVKHAAMALATELTLGSLDLSVYSRPRMWRLRDSQHGKSGLYKIELHHRELREHTPQAFREWARSPRGQLYDACEYEDITPADTAAGWWSLQWQGYVDSTALAVQEPTPIKPKVKARVIDGRLPEDLGMHPLCIRELLAWQSVPVDSREKRRGNAATMHLATYLKELGVSMAEAVQRVTCWAQRLGNISSASDPRATAASASGVVQSVYGGGGYEFRCGFGRALGLSCDEEKCPAVAFRPRQWSRCLGPNPEWQEPPVWSLGDARREAEVWTDAIMATVSAG